MPVVVRIDGFILFFYSADRGEPIHIHIYYQGGTAKFWLKPLKIAYNKGLKQKEITKAKRLVLKYHQDIEEKWIEFFCSDN